MAKTRKNKQTNTQAKKKQESPFTTVKYDNSFPEFICQWPFSAKGTQNILLIFTSMKYTKLAYSRLWVKIPTNIFCIFHNISMINFIELSIFLEK